MKKLILALTVVFSIGIIASPVMMAQQDSKKLKKEITKKATKEARKEAKALKKEGYKVNPGSLPLDKQLEKAWMKQYQIDDEGNPMFYVADGQAVGQTQSAAKLQAVEVAKLNLAGQIETKVAAIMETNIGNKQLNNEDAASITQVIGSSKSMIAQELGRTLTLTEIYRPVKKNVEVWIKIGYSTEMAMDMAKKILKKELSSKTSITSDQIDELLDF